MDLDSYGVPIEALQMLFSKRYQGTVFVTFIQSVMGRLPNAMLLDLGFSMGMIEESPVLLCRDGWSHFREWIAKNGVTSIEHRSLKRKHYLCFRLEGKV